VPLALHHVGHVICGRALSKVQRVDALPVVAGMQHRAIRPAAVLNKKRRAVSRDNLLIQL
jgi:hypothetical protein